jgi:haloacetate dehalogenase
VAFFEGFELTDVDGGAGATLRLRHGGTGPPVVLLHGHPRTHATWHMVAGRLASSHTVVCPDLRGYGASSKVEPYSKRAMAADVAGVMRSLGHDRFAVVGHDRGGYVAFRLAIDHPDQVERLVMLESMPIVERLERTDWRFARAWWHWWFFAQMEHSAEEFILKDPAAWYRVSAELMGDAAYQELRQALQDPDVVHAMLQDYRAGLDADREHDEADRQRGRRIVCPLLVVSLLRDDPELEHDDLGDIWSSWADDVRTAEIDCGHHVSEERPAELAELLHTFLADEM